MKILKFLFVTSMFLLHIASPVSQATDEYVSAAELELAFAELEAAFAEAKLAATTAIDVHNYAGAEKIYTLMLQGTYTYCLEQYKDLQPQHPYSREEDLKEWLGLTPIEKSRHSDRRWVNICRETPQNSIQGIIKLQNLLIKENNWPEAEAYSYRALTFLKQILGPKHDAIALLTQRLGYIFTNQKDYTLAEQTYKQSLTIYDELSSSRNYNFLSKESEKAHVYTMMGLLYKIMGDLPAARITTNNAIQVLQAGISRYEVLPKDKRNDADLADLKAQLASFYNALGRFSEAEKLEKQAGQLNPQVILN